MRKGQKVAVIYQEKGEMKVREAKIGDSVGEAILIGELQEPRQFSMAKEMTGMIKEQIQKDIVKVVEEALTNVEPDYLEKMIKGIKKGEPVKLTHQQGCVFLHVGRKYVDL
jgi:hypothetical protein